MPNPCTVLEVGPDAMLSRMARSWVGSGRVSAWCPSLNRQGSTCDIDTIETTAVALNALFNKTPLDRMFSNRRSFPWQRSPHPLLQKQMVEDDTATKHKVVFHSRLMDLFNDHKIQGCCVLPGAGLVEMAIAAALVHGAEGKQSMTSKDPVVLRDLSFREPLSLQVGSTLVCEVPIDGRAVQFYPAGQPARAICSVGQVSHLVEGSKSTLSLSSTRADCTEEVQGVSKWYAERELRGCHGHHFQTLLQVWQNASRKEVMAKLLRPAGPSNKQYHVHPAVMEGVFQLANFAAAGDVLKSKVWIPTQASEVCFVGKTTPPHVDNTRNYMCAVGRRITSHISASTTSLEMDLELFCDYLARENGSVLTLAGVHFQGMELMLPMAGVYTMQWFPDTLPASNALSTQASRTETLHIATIQLEGAGSPADTVALLSKGIAISTPLVKCDVESFSLFGAPSPWSPSRRSHPDAANDIKDFARAVTDMPAFADALIIPLTDVRPSGGGDDQSGTIALLTQVLRLVQIIAALPAEVQRRKCLLFMTHDCEGPSFPMSRDSICRGAGALGTNQRSSLSVACGLWGLVRSARIELPGALLRCVDTDDWSHGTRHGHPERAATQVLNELNLGDSSMEVSYRQGVRFTPSLSLSMVIPTSTVTAAPSEVSPSWLRDGRGVVLITGGLGGLGIVTAEALVEAGARCVVLASRSGKVKYADQGLNERLEVLRTSGAHVIVEQCDTSIEADVELTLERARLHYGPLRLVVHAAGVALSAALADHTGEMMHCVWGPKADGAWFLHKHMVNDCQLGGFIMYSSLSAIFGNRSQANYCAANEYLDGLARWRASQGLPATSVQWPFISGVGMVGSTTKIDKKLSVGPEVVKLLVGKLVQSSKSQDAPVWPVLTRDYVSMLAEMQTLKPMFSELKVRWTLLNESMIWRKYLCFAHHVTCVPCFLGSYIPDGAVLHEHIDNHGSSSVRCSF